MQIIFIRLLSIEEETLVAHVSDSKKLFSAKGVVIKGTRTKNYHKKQSESLSMGIEQCKTQYYLDTFSVLNFSFFLRQTTSNYYLCLRYNDFYVNKQNTIVLYSNIRFFLTFSKS